jgi:hypothetical protein
MNAAKIKPMVAIAKKKSNKFKAALKYARLPSTRIFKVASHKKRQPASL